MGWGLNKCVDMSKQNNLIFSEPDYDTNVNLIPIQQLKEIR